MIMFAFIIYLVNLKNEVNHLLVLEEILNMETNVLTKSGVPITNILSKLLFPCLKSPPEPTCGSLHFLDSQAR